MFGAIAFAAGEARATAARRGRGRRPLSDAISTQPERKGVRMAGDGNNADPLHFRSLSGSCATPAIALLATKKTKEAHTTLLSCLC